MENKLPIQQNYLIYQKNYVRVGHYRVVHRFLSPEVGQLLVLYLSAVLPFWQFVTSDVLEQKLGKEGSISSSTQANIHDKSKVPEKRCQVYFLREALARYVQDTGHAHSYVTAPLIWMWKTRNYGMKIRWETGSGGCITWEGERLYVNEIDFTMDGFWAMIHIRLADAQAALQPLLGLGPEDDLP
ncbi:hypothetical protein CTA1_7639 [Colletotrichum tanaceti]|uniref:Uncharacterized protein n=1 Tax=Colletotrichum tanaceti TaxID=1306861 RepID=A0A4V6DG24_9PEZI|nr:hypothetical protein CTA1_7639 [Colletotrichum tanaceti]